MKVRYLSILVMLGMLLLAGGAGAAGNSLAADPDPGGVMFVENMGQWDPQVRFQAQGDHGTLWVTNDGLWLSILETAGDAAALEVATEEPGAVQAERPAHGVALKVGFEGATPQAVEPYGLVETEMSYFLGNDPAKWVAGAPVWAGVRYVDLYPGIDLELSGKDGRLAPKLVVREGADLAQVRMRVEGGAAARVSAGQMVVETARGSIGLPLLAVEGAAAESVPVVQMAEGGAVEVAAPFAAAATERAPTELDEASPAEAAQPEAVEPGAVAATTIIFSTYAGGSNGEHVADIGVDKGNNTYVCGTTNSANFPTVAGSFDQTLGGMNDVFVSKYDPAGDLVASSFLGGGGGESWTPALLTGSHECGLYVEASTGSLYITGMTGSPDFPTTIGAYDRTNNGGDAFVCKLPASLASLSYCTFLGGPDQIEQGRAIAADANGNAYVTGSTEEHFPTTAGTAQPVCHKLEIFVAKLNASGTALVWATCLGGEGWEESWGLAVQGTSTYVVGSTNSGDFPTTAGAYDRVIQGHDGFVTKLDGSGKFVYSTFLGGNEDLNLEHRESIKDIAVDSSGRAYVVAYDAEDDYPVTPNGYNCTTCGGDDAALSVLNPTGSGLLYSARYGGSSSDAAHGIAIDGAGNAIVTGSTFSRDLPLVSPYQTYNRSGNGFIAKFQVLGGSGHLPLLYSTYLGGSGSDVTMAVATNSRNYIHVAGVTSSTDFPLKNAAQTTYGGGDSDGFVTRLALAPLKTTEFQDAVHPALTYAGTRDTQLRQANPTTNYGASASLTVDGDEPAGSGKDVCALLQWDVSSIPSGSTLMSAQITLNITDHSMRQAYELYKVKQAWDEMTATWNVQPAHESAILGTAEPHAVGLYTITLTTAGKALVQGWMDAPASNHGFYICDGASTDGFTFDSREAATKTHRPKLTLTWVNPSEPLPDRQDTWLPFVIRQLLFPRKIGGDDDTAGGVR